MSIPILPHDGASRRGSRALVVLGICIALAAAIFVLPPSPAAEAHIDDATTINGPEIGPDTEVRITGLGPGQTIIGYEPVSTAPVDPRAGYPASDPTTGYTPTSSFAGVIRTASIADPSLTADMYCINLRVPTEPGIGYESGTWDESTVTNIGFVTYILNNYYPSTDAPTTPGLTPNRRAAAVQAAIWYLTDGFIVASSSTAVRAAAAAIVEDAGQNGPLVEPPAPDVSISAPSGAFPLNASAGPFAIAAQNAAEATVTTPADFTMYADQEATTVIPDGSSVPSGSEVWIRSSSAVADAIVLRARAAVTVQTGQVYLYDGQTPGLDDAQRLILARTTELEAVAEATASFFAVGSLTVNKDVAGEAAGQQEAIQLRTECGNGAVFIADIPAGADSSQSFTYENLPVGTSCTVTETATGETTTVAVSNDGPQSATVTEEGVTVTLTNTVSLRPGALNVVKVIGGPAAGLQDVIVLSVVCNNGLDEAFAVPAGSAPGQYVQSYDDLPAGTSCTVTETASGATAETIVDPVEPVTVEIPAGGTVDASLMNVVDYRLGDLDVTKVLTGSGAGSQGEVSLQITCDDGTETTFVLPAGAPAGEYHRVVSDLVAGTVCAVIETSNGANVQAVVTSDGPATVEIGRGVAVNAVITNKVTALTPIGPIGHNPLLPTTGGALPGPAIMGAAVALAAGAVLLMIAFLIRRREPGRH